MLDNASDRISTINPREDSDLYAILGISKTSSNLELKRVYHRLALQHHPDRNPDSSETFVKIQHAYDILSDEQMRRIYDRYGDIGIQMADRVGCEILDPRVSDLLGIFAIVSSLLLILFIIFFALLARRIDNRIKWTYATTFTPLWIIDFLFIIGVIWTSYMKAYTKDNGLGAHENEERNTRHEHNYNSINEQGNNEAVYDELHSATDVMNSSDGYTSSPVTDSSPLISSHLNSTTYKWLRSSRKMKTIRRYLDTTISILTKAIPTIYIALIILFQIFIVLKADSVVEWPALYVAAPWLAIELLRSILLTLNLVESISKFENFGEPVLQTGPPKIRLSNILLIAANTYWWLIIRVSLCVLIILKLDGAIQVDWIVVFIPSYLPAIRSALSLALLRRQLSAMGGPEFTQNANTIVMVFTLVFLLIISFVYSFVALLVLKLTIPSSIHMALVLIPAFTALSLAFCFCSCTSCCLVIGINRPLSDEEESIQFENTPIPENRRIE